MESESWTNVSCKKRSRQQKQTSILLEEMYSDPSFNLSDVDTCQLVERKKYLIDFLEDHGANDELVKELTHVKLELKRRYLHLNMQ